MLSPIHHLSLLISESTSLLSIFMNKIYQILDFFILCSDTDNSTTLMINELNHILLVPYRKGNYVLKFLKYIYLGLSKNLLTLFSMFEIHIYIIIWKFYICKKCYQPYLTEAWKSIKLNSIVTYDTAFKRIHTYIQENISFLSIWKVTEKENIAFVVLIF